MEEYIAFFMKNLVLSLAFLATLIAIIFVELRDRQGGSNNLSTDDAILCINRDKGVVIDIRTASDFAKGHIIEALNFDASTIKEQIKKLKKFAKRPLIVVDQNGRSVGEVVKLLVSEGFSVYTLAGGIDAWTREELPLKKD